MARLNLLDFPASDSRLDRRGGETKLLSYCFRKYFLFLSLFFLFGGGRDTELLSYGLNQCLFSISNAFKSTDPKSQSTQTEQCLLAASGNSWQSISSIIEALPVCIFLKRETFAILVMSSHTLEIRDQAFKQFTRHPPSGLCSLSVSAVLNPSQISHRI